LPSKPPLPPTITALLTGLTIVLLTSCAAAASNTSSNQEPGSAGSAPGATTAAVSQPPATPGSGASGCRRDGAPIIVRAGDQPAPVCLHPGETLTMTTETSPTQPWQPMTTSDATVLGCASRPLANGSRTATCHALQPGIATVATTTAAFTGDPHGPAQYAWTLTIHVQAAP
jgi:hypothetical protein